MPAKKKSRETVYERTRRYFFDVLYLLIHATESNPSRILLLRLLLQRSKQEELKVLQDIFVYIHETIKKK